MKNFIRNLYLALVVVILFYASCSSKKEPIKIEPMFCTQDVQICPDGSFTSRDTMNNCRFKPCPK